MQREVSISIAGASPVQLFTRSVAGSRGMPCLVFLHGFPESSDAWTWYLERFAGAGYRCIAPDLRGFARSSRPHQRRDFDIDLLIADVDHLVELGREEGREVYLVGHDWGGAIAWDYATVHGGKLAGVVVLNSPHRGAFAANTRRHPALRRRQNRRSWYIYFFLLPWLPELALRAFDFRWVEHNFRGWAVRDDVFADATMAAIKAHLRRPGALTAAINYYRANALGRYGREIIAHQRGRYDFPPVEARALLLWGVRDPALDVGLLDSIEAFFPLGIEVKRYEDASHWINHEYPERVASDIERFVGAPTPTTRASS